MTALSRRSLLAALSGAAGSALLTAAPPAAAGTTTGTVLAALTRAARPLRSTEPYGDLGDLRPLGAAIGEVPVVALGEAAHGAHELCALKHRVFRYLVLEKGFTTFALETSWTSGLRLNDYVRHGIGDPRAVMAEEFGGGALPWGVHEYLELIEWMRAHNLRRPEAPVEFMGNDIAHPYVPEALFRDVLDHALRHHPALHAELTGLYRELRAHSTTAEFGALPQTERRRLAEQARRARRLLAGPGGSGRSAHEWAVQQARVIAQTATLLAFDLGDPRQVPEAMRYRDELMAFNTVWWYRRTGHRMLLSAHTGHTAYETYNPESYPVVQGTYMRRSLGADYLSVGTTFGHGSATTPRDEGGAWVVRRYPLPPAGGNEHTLNRVPYPVHFLDLRTVPSPAREWLRRARLTRDADTPGSLHLPYALARGHDLLIHLRTISPARPLPSVRS
ncbi:erythromycin esterase family protein [Streptomyces glaucosporus]|uniref:Erythromycin esterase family protein n=1 Tax=Streptomyces glaucosporus TaxID=284044 RepID=A0ABP5W5R6_9ACTN